MAEIQEPGNDLVSRWQRYFRDPSRFGGDEGRVQVATAAAVRAARRGASSTEAAQIGSAEARKSSGTTPPSQGSRDLNSESLVSRWERYFRDPSQFGGDEERVLVATAAAVQAARRGANSTVAAEAGRAAASKPVNSASTRTSPSEPRRGDRRGAGPRSPSQTALFGEAVDVQQRQQLDGGTTLLSIEFLLRTGQEKLTPVVLRGTTVTGRITDGDEVEIKAAQRSRGGQLFASRVYNHTQQHEVQAGIGPTGSWNWWRMAKLRRISTIVVPLLILAAFIAWIVGIAAVANGWIPDIFDSAEQTVTVPDVTGLGGAEAADRVVNAGLRPVFDFEDSSQVEWGKIVRQSPPAGEVIQEGSSVYIFQAR